MSTTKYQIESVSTNYLGNYKWSEHQEKLFTEPDHKYQQYLYSLGDDLLWDDPSTRLRSAYFDPTTQQPLWEVELGMGTPSVDITDGNVLTLVDGEAIFQPVEESTIIKKVKIVAQVQGLFGEGGYEDILAIELEFTTIVGSEQSLIYVSVPSFIIPEDKLNSQKYRIVFSSSLLPDQSTIYSNPFVAINATDDINPENVTSFDSGMANISATSIPHIQMVFVDLLSGNNSTPVINGFVVQVYADISLII